MAAKRMSSTSMDAAHFPCRGGRGGRRGSRGRRRTALLAGFLLAAAAPGCERTGGGFGSPEEGPPRPGGTAVVAGPTDLGPLNSLVAAERITQEFLEHALFLTVVALDEEFRYRPRLAASWTAEGDSALILHLRRDVHWHDGTPTTAADLTFTYGRIADPATGFPDASRFRGVRGVEALDSFTVRLRFEPMPDPLAAWAITPIMPHHLLEATAPADMRQAPFNRQPVGNGPFRFVSRAANDRVTFEANPDFPPELGGRPHLDRLVYRVLPEATARVAELRAGNVDVLLNVPVAEIERLEGSPIRIQQAPSRQFAFIGWNARRPPLDDGVVRRALSMAIDRAGMVRLLRGGYGEAAAGPVPSWHWAFPEGARPLPHDIEGSSALLDAAGLRDVDGDGFREGRDGGRLDVELKYPATDEIFRNAAELVRADLERVGVRLVPRPTEGATLVADITGSARDFDAAMLSLELDFHLSITDMFHSARRDGPFQITGYGDPALDAVLDSLALAGERDATRRHWEQAYEILQRDQPWTFLYFFPNLAAVSPRLNGVRMDARGRLAGVEGWWIASPAAAAEDIASGRPGEGSGTEG